MSCDRELFWPGFWNFWQVQRQLQLRIEAQSKYLKKIIEEHQRLSGEPAEPPGVGIYAYSNDNCLNSDDKTDPPAPAPTSVSPVQDKAASKPLTPDSTCRVSSPLESPKHERVKRQRFPGHETTDLMPAQHILESSSGSDFQQPCSVFLAGRGQFDASSASIFNEQFGNDSGSELWRIHASCCSSRIAWREKNHTGGWIIIMWFFSS